MTTRVGLLYVDIVHNVPALEPPEVELVRELWPPDSLPAIACVYRPRIGARSGTPRRGKEFQSEATKLSARRRKQVLLVLLLDLVQVITESVRDSD